MRRRWWIGIAAFLVCGASRVPAIHNVNPADAEKLLAEGGVLLVDVRTPKEFEEGHIPNAKLFPLTELSQRLNELPSDKTQPILVYGGPGNRSSKAARWSSVNRTMYRFSIPVPPWRDRIAYRLSKTSAVIH